MPPIQGPRQDCGFRIRSRPWPGGFGHPPGGWVTRTLSRRRVLVGLLLLGACGKSSSTTGPHDHRSRRAATLIGYGLANGWPQSDAEQLASRLASNGLTLTEIEYVPFDDLGQISPSRTARLVSAMRSRGIITFINVVNWNGPQQRAQDNRWFRERVREIREAVGTDTVILQGLSEPNPVPKGSEWQRIAREEWPGPFVVYAHQSTTPVFAAGPYDYIDTHHCHLARMLDFMKSAGPRLINNTDCGPLITARLGPGMAARMTRFALDHRTNLLIYDHGQVTANDAILKEMGDEIARADA